MKKTTKKQTKSKANHRAEAPKIIGLHGPKGCGKSTVAGFLAKAKHLPKPVVTLSFATPIKQMLGVLLGRDVIAMGQEEKENPKLGILGKSPRQLLQTLGTEWGRHCVGESIWLEVMMDRILKSGAGTVIIDDVRMENEAIFITGIGGVVCAITRDGVSHTGEHPSETHLPGELIDWSISNTSLADLKAMASSWDPFAGPYQDAKDVEVYSEGV